MTDAAEEWIILIQFVTCLFLAGLFVPMTRRGRVVWLAGFFSWIFLYPSWAFASGVTMQLDSVRVADLARIVYGDLLKRSFVLDDSVLQSQQVVSLGLVDLPKKEVDAISRELLTMRGFELVEQGKVLLVRSHDSSGDGLLIYQPRNRSARYLSDLIMKVTGVQAMGSRSIGGSPELQAAAAKQPEKTASVSSVISQGASDQLAYQCSSEKCGQLRKLLGDLDTPEAQVVLRAVVYEVGTTRGEGSALQVAAKLLQGTVTLNAGSALSGASQIHLGAANLDAVLSVLDQDGRFKSVSRPMLRVRTGAQAKFSVGQQVPVLGAVSLDNNGNAVQSVDYRQSGTIFTVQPDVRLDVIDLNVTQELSSFVQTTTGVNNSPTLLQRSATSQLSVKSGEVVVFAGLEESHEDEADSQLFGISLSSKKNSNTNEVLLFIEAQRI